MSCPIRASKLRRTEDYIYQHLLAPLNLFASSASHAFFWTSNALKIFSVTFSKRLQGTLLELHAQDITCRRLFCGLESTVLKYVQ